MGIFGKGKGGERESEDIRLALKLPGRGSLKDKQISTAFKKVKQMLRSSSGGGGGRTGVSSRQRGSSAAGSAAGRLGNTGGVRGAGATAAKPLQRVSVRWVYSKNQGDGQWGAHGKYIERESSQEKELNKRPELLAEIEVGRELADPSIKSQRKDIDHERSDIAEPDRYTAGDRDTGTGAGDSIADRYGAAPDLNDRGRVSALRQSYAAAVGSPPSAKSINDLRSLSSVGMVQRAGRSELLLQGDASEIVVQRGTQDADRVRRGSGGKPGTDRVAVGGLDAGGVGYGSGGHSVAISATLNAWQKGGDERMFKLIISPEFGDRMDLRKHVGDLMKQMEKDLGTKLEWVAANHYNTDHPHAHVAIRGMDDKGKSLEISPEYIAEGSRIRAQELATKELGYRSERDVAESLDRQVAQQRFTEIDRSLKKRAVNNEVSFEGEPPGSEKARDTRLRQIRRLVQLSDMGLAEKTGNKSWRLSPALETALRQMQVSQDRLKTKFAHREMISDPSAPLVVTELKELGQRVAGKVVGTGLNEATNRPYIMVEGLDGKVHYLNQSPKVQKLRGEGGLKAGEYVALEVVERKDRDGKVLGTTQRVEQYGRALSPALLDAELLKGGKVVVPAELKKTVAGAFRDAAAARLGRLQAAGAVEVEGALVRPKSAVAHDRLNFEDAGVKTVEFDGKGSMLATVLAKGRESIAVAPTYGRKQQLTALQLEALGLQHKYVAEQASLFVGVDAKGKAMAAVVKPEQLPAMVADPRPNRLDLMAQQLKPIQLPPGHPVTLAIQERAEVWKQRGVDVQAPDFGKAATVWRKNVEWAESGEDIANAIKTRQLNRLDWMLQQEQLATSAPLQAALQERAQVWQQRGLDPKDPSFTVRANVWRKGIELQEAAQQKGVDQVLDDLSRELGKPVRHLDAQPGRQISGRVLLVKKEDNYTTVVVDTGRELTSIRQPAPNDVALKAGDRMRAKVEKNNDDVNQRRLATWRFADLEREQARQKGKADKAF